MDKYSIVGRIEEFAPLATQEPWDCSGWIVETGKMDIKKIMLALTVTEDVFNQALESGCDMIISHHPLFKVPLNFGKIDIYCAHTNMDIAFGGTTDALIMSLGLQSVKSEGFLRYVDLDITVEDFVQKLRKISPNMRYVNNFGLKKLKRIAFCAGSGSEFINDAYQNGADSLVTGDLKFHTALDSPIVLFDLGHFESEIMVLDVFRKLIGCGVVNSEEKSPFIY